MSTSGWVNFWKDQKESFYETMRINTVFFARQLEKLFHIKPSHQILDYGCGPGFLADALGEKNISITGADINHFFIEQCKRNHAGSLFLYISTDIEETKKIFEEQLGKKKFDFIILLSITQYFDNVTVLDTVVKMLVRYLSENGKIIVADVSDENTSSYRDALSLLFQCIKNGKPLAFFKFIFYLLFSSYNKLSKKEKLLKLSEQSIGQLAADNSLSYKKVEGLTIHASRTNYVLSKGN